MKNKKMIISISIAISIFIAIWIFTTQSVQDTVAVTNMCLNNPFIAKILAFVNTHKLFFGMSLQIRQWAHVVEFFVFGISVAIVSKQCHKSMVFALCICVLCSLFDQTHKLFVPGREFTLFDLVLDCVGYCSAIGVVYGLHYLINAWNLKHRVKGIDTHLL